MSSNKTYAQQAPGATGVDPNHKCEQGFGFEIVDAARGIVRPLGPVRKKFAICGFAASSRNLAPFDDPDYEIWGLNQLYRHIPRASRWFDIHANWREDNVEGTDHPGYLAQMGIPIYMSEAQAEVPTSRSFPVDRAIERVAGTDYFTSTVAFMVALAIMEIDEQVNADVDALAATAALPLGDLNVDDPQRTVILAAREIAHHPRALLKWRSDRYEEREISLWGIDLIVGTEYDWQKSCVEFLLGLAQARGITLRLPPKCALLRQRWRYGFQTEAPGFPWKYNEMKKRGDALAKERENLIARLQTIDGAMQENGYWLQVGDLRIKGGDVKLNEDT